MRVQCAPVGASHLGLLRAVYAHGGLGAFYRSASAFLFLATKVGGGAATRASHRGAQ